MPSRRLFPNEPSSLVASACDLQRAAGDVQAHAADADYIPTLGITLAHVEEALDRLSVGMLQMANGVIEWYAGPGSAGREDALPPQARALCFHLRAAALSLEASENACASSRNWTRQLVDILPDTERGLDWADRAPTGGNATELIAHEGSAPADRASRPGPSNGGPPDDSAWARWPRRARR
jgi:hypothetical protein